MKNLPLAALLGAFTFLGTSSAVFAQTAEPIAPAQAADTLPEGYLIEIKNVPSFWVAYQLDPKNNVKPNVFTELDSIRPAPAPETEPQGAFTLPTGIKRIASLDPRNMIVVVYDGNKEAIRQLEDLIAVLDQPLRQLEIDTQSVEMDSTEFDKIGVQSLGAVGDFRIDIVRSNFTARVNALVAADKAKIISAIRTTAINNLSADVYFATNQQKPREAVAANDSVVPPRSVGADLKLTPTINGDDTITLLMKASAMRGDKLSNLVNIANLRDGETLALTGLSQLFAHEEAKDPALTCSRSSELNS